MRRWPRRAASAATTATSSVAPESIKVVPGTLNWWPGWPGTYMRDVANAFMKDNPTIKVEPVLFYRGQHQAHRRCRCGHPVRMLCRISAITTSSSGVRCCRSTTCSKAEKISTTDGDIRAANWNAFHWQGKYYGVPAVDTAGRGAFGYNVDLVQAVGLDPNQPPQTWDDVYLWHQKLTKKDAAGNLLQLGMDPLFSRANATSDGDTWLWPEMWGFHYFDVNTLKYDIDRAETIDFYTTITEVLRSLGPRQAGCLSEGLHQELRRLWHRQAGHGHHLPLRPGRDPQNQSERASTNGLGRPCRRAGRGSRCRAPPGTPNCW